MKKAIKLTLAASAVAVLAACGGGGGGGDVSEGAKPVESNQAIIDAAILEAKTYGSSQMRDPSSVQFQNIETYRVGSDTTVCGEFNAKNGFGAYVGFKKFFYRPSQSELFKFVYESTSTGSLSFIIIPETLKLINTVCSDVSAEAANAAQTNYLQKITP